MSNVLSDSQTKTLADDAGRLLLLEIFLEQLESGKNNRNFRKRFENMLFHLRTISTGGSATVIGHGTGFSSFAGDL